MFGDITQGRFPLVFDYRRLLSAAYTSADGATAYADADIPRFDHFPDGSARGLIIERGQVLGLGDTVTLDPLMLPEDMAGLPVTVFHAKSLADGSIDRRAWYSRDGEKLIASLLSGEARHMQIGVVDGFRVNKGGFVRYRYQTWWLQTVLGDGAGAAMATNNSIAAPLMIEG